MSRCKNCGREKLTPAWLRQRINEAADAAATHATGDALARTSQELGALKGLLGSIVDTCAFLCRCDEEKPARARTWSKCSGPRHHVIHHAVGECPGQCPACNAAMFQRQEGI